MATNFTVVEFYSGLGGIHLALECSSVSFSVKAAFEINDAANAVYCFNFPSVSLMQRNILSLSSTELDILDAALWTMSPPCQPFTRQGKQKDVDDSRTDSFMHLLDILQKMQKPPKYIFLENVKGFETSQACIKLKITLKKINYNFKEFLLSPNQFGIPNSRLRYYLLARSNSVEAFDFLGDLKTDEICSDSWPLFPKSVLRPLSEFLENVDDGHFEKYLLKSSILGKHSEILDIVTPESYNSCCFTKGYTHYIEGTGSVLQSDQTEKLDVAYAEARSVETVEEKIQTLSRLKLRWFTAREVANLMGFPLTFGFPPSVTTKQQYRLLGNSVNVVVVSKLLKFLLLNKTS